MKPLHHYYERKNLTSLANLESKKGNKTNFLELTLSHEISQRGLSNTFRGKKITLSFEILLTLDFVGHAKGDSQY